MVSGDIAFEHMRIPLTALMPSEPATRSTSAPPDIAFAVNLNAGNDVRVQGGNVDVGARGKASLGGTLASPTLRGRFSSTGGSLHFYRTFALQSGTVRFSPDRGLIPLVDATATTSVRNPDTDILLHVTGLATSVAIDFSSNPAYDREEILTLLAGAQNFGVGRVRSASTGNQPSLLQNAALGYVNDQFTQSLLEPLQSALGQSLGLQNLQLNAGFGSAYGLSATKSLGKHLSASFAQSYGLTQRQSVGVSERINSATSVQLTLFSASSGPQNGVIGALPFDPTKPTDLSLLSLIPPAGTQGFTLSYQHRFR
jgi:hypothetical protein